MTTVRITKELAEDTAKRMTKIIFEKLSQKEKEYKIFCTELYLSKIPASVLATLKTIPEEYRRDCTSSSLCSPNGEREYVHFSDSVPERSGYVILSSEEFELLTLKREDVETYKKESRDLLRDITNSIYSCKTLSSLKVKFPQAYKFLSSLTKENPITIVALPVEKYLEKLSDLESK